MEAVGPLWFEHLLWVRDCDGTSPTSRLPSRLGSLLHLTDEDTEAGVYVQGRAGRTVSFQPQPGCCYGSCYLCPQLPKLESGVSPKPWSSHSELFHFGLSSLPPRKASLSMLSWQTLYSFLCVLIPVVSVGTSWHLLPTSNEVVLVLLEVPGPTLGLGWRNPTHSLLPASWEQCWALSCPPSQDAHEFALHAHHSRMLWTSECPSALRVLPPPLLTWPEADSSLAGL